MSSFIFAPSVKALVKRPPPLAVWANFIKYKLSPRRARVGHTPISLVIYVNKRCNFKCSFCFTYSDLNRPGWQEFELSKNRLLEILLSPFGRRSLRVGLLGGEPFLCDDIFALLDICHAKRKLTTVVTNASRVSASDRRELITRGPTFLGISLYDNNRNDVANLSVHLAQARKAFWVQSVVSADNLDAMTDKLEFAKEHRIKNFILSNYHPLHSGEYAKVIFSTNSDYKDAAERLRAKARKYKINLTLPNPVEAIPTRRSCQMPFSYVHVDATGTLGACCFRAPNREHGNLFEHDPWNTSYNQRLRQSFIDSTAAPFKECQHCENFGRDLYGV